MTSHGPFGDQLNARSRPEQRRDSRPGDRDQRNRERQSEGGVDPRATRGFRVPLREAVQEVILEPRSIERRLDKPDRFHFGVEVADPHDPKACPFDERRQ